MISIAAITKMQTITTFYLSPYYCYLRQLYNVRTHGVEHILELVNNWD